MREIDCSSTLFIASHTSLHICRLQRACFSGGREEVVYTASSSSNKNASSHPEKKNSTCRLCSRVMTSGTPRGLGKEGTSKNRADRVEEVDRIKRRLKSPRAERSRRGLSSSLYYRGFSIFLMFFFGWLGAGGHPFDTIRPQRETRDACYEMYGGVHACLHPHFFVERGSPTFGSINEKTSRSTQKLIFVRFKKINK